MEVQAVNESGCAHGDVELEPVGQKAPALRPESSRIVDYTIRALQNKKLLQKLGPTEHHEEGLQHAWIFQFIDIIYVGTIFNISGIITQCGPSKNVFITCFAYFVIMFSSRLSFDVYNCVSGASGVPHLVAFCLYGAGVFFMTVNIRVSIGEETETSEEHRMLSELGTCEYSLDYSAGFAVSFIVTRVVLVIMYVLYFYFFHQSNLHGHAPDAGKHLSSADLEAAAQEITRKLSTNSEHSHSSAHTHNPISFRSTQQAEDLIRDLHLQNRESVVKRHFTRICLLKIGPAIVSSLLAIGMIAGASPTVILPIVATVEFSGDFITAYFVKEASDWRDLTVRREFAMERLGLFFMLVLGEAVLGLAVQHFTSGQDYATTYPILLFAFFTIFSVGMQFFEQLQTFVKVAGPHPLDLRRLSPVYIWLVCLISFFMLVASNGIVGIYEHALNIHEGDVSYNEKKVANGLGGVGILIIVLRCMDKLYYRQKVLPTAVFDWVEQFYADDVAPQQRQRIKSVDSTNSFTESGVTKGFRRILPLCLMRIAVSLLQFSMFLFDITSVVNFLGYTFVVTVTPNLAEVVVEMRNFFKHHFYHKSRHQGSPAQTAAVK